MSNTSIDTSMFYKLLDKQSVTNSYKHLLLATIVKSVMKGDLTVDLKHCAAAMIQMTWKLITKQNLSLGKHDSIAAIIKELRYLPFFETCTDGKAVYDFLMTSKNNYLDDLIKRLNNFAPYRLLSPFYEPHLKGLADEVKNKKILELNSGDPNALYHIHPGKLELNKEWSSFIIKNYSTICEYISDKFVLYLSRKNPNTTIKQSALLFE